MVPLTEGYFQVPNAIFDNLDLGLSRYERIIYIYLCRCGNQGSDAYPGYTGIAKRCGISRPVAVSAVKGLEKRNLITVIRRPKSNRSNESNLYLVNSLPSRQGLLGLVNPVNHPSKQGLPNKELSINNHAINNKDTSNIVTSVIREYAPPPTPTLIRKEIHIGKSEPEPIIGKATYPEKIAVYLSNHGPSPIKVISRATGIDRNMVNTTLHNGRGKRFIHVTEQRVWDAVKRDIGDTTFQKPPTYGDRIEAFLQTHGPLPVRLISKGSGINSKAVEQTLYKGKGKRFQHFPEKQAWDIAGKDTTPIMTGGSNLKLRMVVK